MRKKLLKKLETQKNNQLHEAMKEAKRDFFNCIDNILDKGFSQPSDDKKLNQVQIKTEQ